MKLSGSAFIFKGVRIEMLNLCSGKRTFWKQIPGVNLRNTFVEGQTMLGGKSSTASPSKCEKPDLQHEGGFHTI